MRTPLLTKFCLFAAAMSLAYVSLATNAWGQTTSPMLGEVAGDNVSVIGPSNVVAGSAPRAIAFGGGSTSVVLSGKIHRARIWRGAHGGIEFRARAREIQCVAAHHHLHAIGYCNADGSRKSGARLHARPRKYWRDVRARRAGRRASAAPTEWRDADRATAERSPAARNNFWRHAGHCGKLPLRLRRTERAEIHSAYLCFRSTANDG